MNAEEIAIRKQAVAASLNIPSVLRLNKDEQRETQDSQLVNTMPVKCKSDHREYPA
jgi:hypothetical protein